MDGRWERARRDRLLRGATASMQVSTIISARDWPSRQVFQAASVQSALLPACVSAFPAGIFFKVAIAGPQAYVCLLCRAPARGWYTVYAPAAGRDCAGRLARHDETEFGAAMASPPKPVMQSPRRGLVGGGQRRGGGRRAGRRADRRLALATCWAGRDLPFSAWRLLHGLAALASHSQPNILVYRYLSTRPHPLSLSSPPAPKPQLPLPSSVPAAATSDLPRLPSLVGHFCFCVRDFPSTDATRRCSSCRFRSPQQTKHQFRPVSPHSPAFLLPTDLLAQ